MPAPETGPSANASDAAADPESETRAPDTLTASRTRTRCRVLELRPVITTRLQTSARTTKANAAARMNSLSSSALSTVFLLYLVRGLVEFVIDLGHYVLE